MSTRSAPCLCLQEVPHVYVSKGGNKKTLQLLFRPQPDGQPLLGVRLPSTARSYLSRFSPDVYEFDDLSPSGGFGIKMCLKC
ncbi:hypothetical protein MRB53_020940 [Persea americana]|uniref:Uncharacterized protein n=1 Tax=Persea americana TaxID=3435 RepID=A0ACC2L2M4_PERAE|nr:hypothetical protein MRB53_020940 [Persea americana]